MDDDTAKHIGAMLIARSRHNPAIREFCKLFLAICDQTEEFSVAIARKQLPILADAFELSNEGGVIGRQIIEDLRHCAHLPNSTVITMMHVLFDGITGGYEALYAKGN